MTRNGVEIKKLRKYKFNWKLEQISIESSVGAFCFVLLVLVAAKFRINCSIRNWVWIYGDKKV